MLFFIQTLPRILCACAISHVSFLDLFGPIAGTINPIIYVITSPVNSSQYGSSNHTSTLYTTVLARFVLFRAQNVKKKKKKKLVTKLLKNNVTCNSTFLKHSPVKYIDQAGTEINVT